MKLSIFRKSNVQAASAAPKVLLSLEQVKAQLRVMPPKQLEAVLNAALKRATPTHVPATLQAMAQLHREAVYVDNGSHIGTPIGPTVADNAEIFVNMRYMVANMPVPGVALPALPRGYDASMGMCFAPAAQAPLPTAPKPANPYGQVRKAKKQATFALPDLDGNTVMPPRGILKYPGV